MRYAARTDPNHTEISDALRAAGYRVYYIRWPVDLLVGTGRGWLPMEIKRDAKAKLTEDQERLIREAKDPVAVVCDVESAIRACRALGA